jgi:hypothetical protein
MSLLGLGIVAQVGNLKCTDVVYFGQQREQLVHFYLLAAENRYLAEASPQLFGDCE